MNLFDIKVKNNHLLDDGSIYLEFQPFNNELQDFIMHTEVITEYDDVNTAIKNIIPSVRSHIFHSLPEEIQQKYVNAQFKINNSIENPRYIDYDILGLHKKRTIIKGELIKVEYYKDFNTGNSEYSDLVIKEERVYNRNEIGLAQYRQMEISWYLNNEDVGMTVDTMKFYTPKESIDEGKIRRLNIVSEAKIYSLNTIGQQYSFDLLNDLKVNIDLYIDGYKTLLINEIQSIDKPYLSLEIKNNLIDILTF